MGGLQLAKPAPLVGERQQWHNGEGGGSSKESMVAAERRGSSGRKESGCHGKGGGGLWRVVLGKFGLVRFRAIFARLETGQSGP